MLAIVKQITISQDGRQVSIALQETAAVVSLFRERSVLGVHPRLPDDHGGTARQGYSGGASASETRDCRSQQRKIEEASHPTKDGGVGFLPFCSKQCGQTLIYDSGCFAHTF